jgi:phosphoesterase RecJ-like protein
VCGHVNPDADCIGSLLVMASVLEGMGKAVRLMLPETTVSRKYQFLLGLIPPPRPAGEPELIIVLDTAMLKRINKPREYELPDVPVCNIDHHLGNERYGRYNWVDTTAASCSQMVFLLVRELGAALTCDQATLLYAGLHCDTCGFSLASTDHQALMIGAELAGSGAKVGWVCQNLNRSRSVSDFKLMQVVYANTQISPCGQFAWSEVTGEELSAVGATPNDIDEQVAVPRSIEGVKIAALFSETQSGKVRINLRAEDEVNILPLAKFLGGGGHAQAAGAILEGNFKEIVARVRSLSLDYLNNPAGLPVQESLIK